MNSVEAVLLLFVSIQNCKVTDQLINDSCMLLLLINMKIAVDLKQVRKLTISITTQMANIFLSYFPKLMKGDFVLRAVTYKALKTLSNNRPYFQLCNNGI
jgi:hypothetical protein